MVMVIWLLAGYISYLNLSANYSIFVYILESLSLYIHKIFSNVNIVFVKPPK